MEQICIREVSKDSKIEICGHVFNGLAEIRNAVEAYSRIGKDDSWTTEPKKPVEGVHVICVYEPYPCFDSYDYASEDRDYRNYFFSTEPFTMEQIERLSKLPGNFNAQIVNETMPEWALPAVYYGGESKKIIVATQA